MNTGIVFEIKNGKAIIMKNGGNFITVKADPNWKKGDIVQISKNNYNLKTIYKIVACFAFFIFLSGFGYKFYYNQTSLVSIDINPSIEIGINSFGRVVSLDALNDQGTDILNQVNIINMKYNKAVEALISNEQISNYIENNSYITFAVQSNNKHKEKEILSNLKALSDTTILPNHHSAEIDYYTVDSKLINNAHDHGISPGKYMMLLKLKDLSSNINIDDYSNYSIKDIKEEISHCNDQNSNNKHNKNSKSHHN